MKLAVVIPAYNEAANIGATVRGVAGAWDAIVVDDCSSDQTSRIAAEAGAQVVRQPRNGGYDQAISAGLEYARKNGYTHAVTFDADGQHPAGKLGEFAAALERVDLVAGIRPNTARWSEAVFAVYTNLRYGLRDPLCGMKGYNLAALGKDHPFDTYGSINTELALRLLRAKRGFEQLPIPLAERTGQSRFGSSWRANKKILSALFKAWRHLGF